MYSANNKTTLIIAPHADDEVLGVGGTTHKLLSSGEQVHVVVCGKRKTDIDNDISDALSVYTTATILPYADENYYDSFNYILKSIESVYNRVKPDVVYIPNNNDFNRDHKCIHEICEITTRRYQSHQPSCVIMYEIPSSTTQSFNNNFRCNTYITLTQEDIDYKIQTLYKYTTEHRQYPNPRSPEGIISYAKFRGMECNSMYAEGFNIIYNKQ